MALGRLDHQEILTYGRHAPFALAKDQLEQQYDTWDSHALEVAYQMTCRDVDYVYSEEHARRLRLQQMLLEDDRNDFQQQLLQSEQRIEDLGINSRQLQQTIDVVTVTLESSQADVRIKTREIETLKAELDSLHRTTMDSKKLVTEKLAISRELSSLKLEVKHLRSQAASHSALLAEKLSMDRQINTLQVEFESEKRLLKRVNAQEERQRHEDAKFESQVVRLQAELNKERKEREKAESESKMVSVESTSKTIAFESRLDAFKSKLKLTKDLLKKTQIELQGMKSQQFRASPDVRPSDNTKSSPPRKRGASHMDEATMLGTPKDIPNAKMARKVSSMVGEKSTFSITPFFNRTASMAPTSPVSPGRNRTRSRHGSGVMKTTADHQKTAVASIVVEDSSKDVGKFNEEEVNSAVDAGNKSTMQYSKSRPVQITKAASHLEQVLEEEHQAQPSKNVGTSDVLPDDGFIDEAYAKKSKRKLLGGRFGKSLFDDDDGDGQSDRAHPGVKGLGGFGRDRMKGSKLAEIKLMATANTFGSISPLKRDRRVGMI